MNAFVAVTDRAWFELLAQQAGLEEVNFWQPSGGRGFSAIEPGDFLLFKLHSPDNFVVGGGVFAHHTSIPITLAWQAFGIGNGASSFIEMRERVVKYLKKQPAPGANHEIGCILLKKPFFLPRDRWVPQPADWSMNIVQGKTYDLLTGHGKILWDAIQTALGARDLAQADRVAEPPEDDAERYGQPTIVLPRLGQGTFRVMVTEAYGRRCAVTRERTLPVLEAAHIKPFADGGTHDLRNGLLLRSDIHTLFDAGYVTVTPATRTSGKPEYHFEVSKRIREEFENGHEYYALHGREVAVPAEAARTPEVALLTWHNTNRYLG